MKRLLITLFFIASNQAGHFMKSEEAKALEADYKKVSAQNDVVWKDHWASIKQDALRLVAGAVDKPKKERYERLARCARFLEVHHNYFTYRDRINQVTQGIPENELDTVPTKGFGHPLCQKIEKVDEATKEQLIHHAQAVLKEEKLKATLVSSWLPQQWNGWIPQWSGYYDVDGKFIENQSIVSEEKYPESNTVPEPDIAKKALAILACKKCIEHGNKDYTLEKKIDERFFSKKNA